MTTLAELKVKADNLGLDRGIVRLYGDLRKIETWERAITSHQTVTVEAVEIADTVADEIDKNEIIPFIPEIELAVDCPPPPPIIRPCPAPEIPVTIPGIEIAERESPRPGEGRGDERFKNLGDRLFKQIKTDILEYFEHFKEDISYCWKNDYFDDNHHQELTSLIDLMEWNIKNKQTIFDVWSTVPYFKREGFYKLIPFAIQHFFTNGIPPVDFWECDRYSHFLLLYRPAPIPTLSEKFGGVFIPNRLHELGEWHYLWKFPGAIQCENFFHNITDAKEYAIIPANQCIKAIEQPKQLVLTGV